MKTSTILKEVLLYIWQLPQNLLGFVLSRFAYKTVTYSSIKVYISRYIFRCGVSLGKYIILDPRYENSAITIKHEHGHQIQSLYLGWLYLPIVGISSAIFNNLWDRLFHKNKDWRWRSKWYYNRFPENWADKLGHVHRFAD